MSKQIKTAEEILTPLWDNYKINGMSFKSIALKCMQDYADQFINADHMAKANKWDSLDDKLAEIYRRP